MDRRLITVILVLAAAAQLTWYVSTPSQTDLSVSQNSPTVDIPAAVSQQATTTPGTVVTPAPASLKPSSLQTESEPQQSRALFEQLLRDYGSSALSPDDKILIETSLRELNREPLGRAFIIDTFFSIDAPELATALYNLMLDADLKDVTLLEGLIQRDSAEPGIDSKRRIVDLIADLNVQEEAVYSPVLDEYLLQMALNPDVRLRNAAATQRIWYVAQHQPDNLAALGEYLLDPAPRVREEMYSLIRARADNHRLSGQAELTLALEAALQADYLGLSAQEQERIRALLTTLAPR